jgi:hypothetical protein
LSEKDEARLRGFMGGYPNRFFDILVLYEKNMQMLDSGALEAS